MKTANSIQLFDVIETAKILRLCPRSIRKALKDKALASVRIGRSVRVSSKALEEFVASRTINANQ